MFGGTPCRTRFITLRQAAGWVEDYNDNHPHPGSNALPEGVHPSPSAIAGCPVKQGQLHTFRRAWIEHRNALPRWRSSQSELAHFRLRSSNLDGGFKYPPGQSADPPAGAIPALGVAVETERDREKARERRDYMKQLSFSPLVRGMLTDVTM